MSELATEYEGKVKFELISAEETLAAGEDMAEFGFNDAKHGLVAFDSQGEAKVKLPGHNFGREEIVSAIDQVLGGL
ncbi:hypothetical protein CMO84_11325 [Candidatus Woesearchaeota archaeon]|nr:hypothetical protein [Candidatus Woesearchaeota archaeon]MDP6739837.1 hypothetical protein [Planctomycetota bacterium]MDP6938060.1 hypothetical protein [Planctomycetota bacterium]